MKYKVIIETDIINRPKDHEMKAALIVANEYFKFDVIFLRPEVYKTPDLKVKDTKWELKSPLGNGKKTIENNMRAARKQSEHLVLDFSRMKLHQTKAISNINYYLKNSSSNQFKRVIVITKDRKILEIL
jgi:Contact-dependent growth inhibition CdiA C-terminal domain